jgi:hypothetical protein
MRYYFLFVAKGFGLLLAIMVLLDLVYTGIHYQAKNRSKVNWLNHIHNREVDYILVGSSRVKYHLMPELIEEETGTVGFNLGESDQDMNEVLLMVKLFFANGNSAKRVFVQVDNNWNNTEPNELASSAFMPFIRQSVIRNHYANYGSNYLIYTFVPFVRYMYFGHAIGFRELLNVLFNDDTSATPLGFIDLNGRIKQDVMEHEGFRINGMNELVNEMQAVSNQNNAEIFFFTAPTLLYKKDELSQIEPFLPNYVNYANDISDKQYFYDPIHLNSEGAILFTKMFSQTFFHSIVYPSNVVGSKKVNDVFVD